MSASGWLTWQQDVNRPGPRLGIAMDLEATGPPKAKRAPAKSALRKLRLLGAYRLFSLLQAPVGFMFWLIEQRRWRIVDEIEST